jgi:putative FmdB family regulatory protein
MPIYEYRCEHCGDFEEMQRITDPPLDRCPTCRRKVRRLISSTSFQLKGSGWYLTDYARAGGNGEKAEKAEKGEKKQGDAAAATTEKSSDAKAERKVEAKAESKSAPAASSEKPTS